MCCTAYCRQGARAGRLGPGQVGGAGRAADGGGQAGLLQECGTGAVLATGAQVYLKWVGWKFWNVCGDPFVTRRLGTGLAKKESQSSSACSARCTGDTDSISTSVSLPQTCASICRVNKFSWADKLDERSNDFYLRLPCYTTVYTAYTVYTVKLVSSGLVI